MSALDELTDSNNWMLRTDYSTGNIVIYEWNGELYAPIQHAAAELVALRAERDELEKQLDMAREREIAAGNSLARISIAHGAVSKELDELKRLLFDIDEFWRAVPHSYANGNESQGTDEGEYYGQRHEKTLADRIAAVLAGYKSGEESK